MATMILCFNRQHIGSAALRTIWNALASRAPHEPGTMVRGGAESPTLASRDQGKKGARHDLCEFGADVFLLSEGPGQLYY
jgi:hypothetical protein